MELQRSEGFDSLGMSGVDLDVDLDSNIHIYIYTKDTYAQNV